MVHVFLPFPLFPETYGKTLEEMDEVFNESIWAFKVRTRQSRLVEEIEVAKGTLEGKDGTKVKHLERYSGSLHNVQV